MPGVLVTKATDTEGHVTRRDAVSVLQLQVKEAKGAQGQARKAPPTPQLQTSGLQSSVTTRGYNSLGN